MISLVFKLHLIGKEENKEETYLIVSATINKINWIYCLPQSSDNTLYAIKDMQDLLDEYDVTFHEKDAPMTMAQIKAECADRCFIDWTASQNPAKIVVFKPSEIPTKAQLTRYSAEIESHECWPPRLSHKQSTKAPRTGFLSNDTVINLEPSTLADYFHQAILCTGRVHKKLPAKGAIKFDFVSTTETNQ